MAEQWLLQDSEASHPTAALWRAEPLLGCPTSSRRISCPRKPAPAGSSDWDLLVRAVFSLPAVALPPVAAVLDVSLLSLPSSFPWNISFSPGLTPRGSSVQQPEGK